MPSEPDTLAQMPRISNVGLDGVLVCFGDSLTGPTNNAALAFRAAVDSADLAGVTETSSTLASVYVAFDLTVTSYVSIVAGLQALVSTRDWSTAPISENRKLWTIPIVIGGDLAPGFDAAVSLTGLTHKQARADLLSTRVRVLTLGFAPGQPYLGPLGDAWNIPRQTELTAQVPAGALVAAICQLTLFASAAPTGWRHVAQTAFRTFLPNASDPFPLRAGDSIRFQEIDVATYHHLESDPDTNGGASFEVLQ
jgi:KipI family sensor histidine kinase inhibitor